MPSDDEKKAGRAAIIPTLHALVNAFVPDMFGYKQRVNAAIDHDPQVSQYIDEGVEEVLVAAEHVREGKQPPVPTVHLHQKLAMALARAAEGDYIHGTDIPDRPDIIGGV